MNETSEDIKDEPPSITLPVANVVIEDSIASRTKEITKRPKRERSPSKFHEVKIAFSTIFIDCLALQVQPPAPKIKKIKEVAPKLPDKTKWTMEEQKQFFSALRIVSSFLLKIFFSFSIVVWKKLRSTWSMFQYATSSYES